MITTKRLTPKKFNTGLQPVLDKYNLRDKYLESVSNARTDVKTKVKISWKWYGDKLRTAAARMNALKFLGDNIATQDTRITVGTMVSFFYDPKTKDKLPYYDTFPMILPFAADATHFTALNLHYLHPRTRAVLLEKLSQFSNDDSLTPNAKLKFTWQTLKTLSMDASINHCVKQYLFSHVKSRFVVIPPAEWEYVIWLPVERFKKADNETVWKARK